MKHSRTLLLTLACAVPLAATAAPAQLRHHGRLRHAGHAGHTRLAHRSPGPAYGAYPAYDPYRGDSFNAGAAQVPPRGFYDGYEGPGATVLRRGLAAQYEPGATSELAPEAKQTATGGPVGGLPNRSGP